MPIISAVTWTERWNTFLEKKWNFEKDGNFFSAYKKNLTLNFSFLCASQSIAKKHQKSTKPQSTCFELINDYTSPKSKTDLKIFCSQALKIQINYD